MQSQQYQISSPEFPTISCILTSIKKIAHMLQHSPVLSLESKNVFGDTQLHQDVTADEIVEQCLRECWQVRGFASQERPVYCGIQRKEGKEEGEDGYVVTYDPLDGSSIIDTNFAVGSIFSIWPYTPANLLNTKPSTQTTSILAIYGPRTTAILYNSNSKKVQQLTLLQNKWILSHDNLRIAQKTNMFCPGNLRAVTENEGYRHFVDSWIDRQFTLRYTGGLVPDIGQIFVKGHGIFANVASKSYKAKLRVLYEVAAVAFLVHQAGGLTITDGGISVLDYQIKGYDDRISFAAGSALQVQTLTKLFTQSPTQSEK